MTGLLLQTLTVLCQTGIYTDKNGTHVPLAVMRNMIKDILKGEECDSESVKLYNTVNLYEAIIRGQDSSFNKSNKEIDNLKTVIRNMQTEASLSNVKSVVDGENIKNLNESYNQLTQSYNKSVRQVDRLKITNKIELIALVAAAIKIFIFK